MYQSTKIYLIVVAVISFAAVCYASYCLLGLKEAGVLPSFYLVLMIYAASRLKKDLIRRNERIKALESELEKLRDRE